MSDSKKKKAAPETFDFACKLPPGFDKAEAEVLLDKVKAGGLNTAAATLGMGFSIPDWLKPVLKDFITQLLEQFLSKKA